MDRRSPDGTVSGTKPHQEVGAITDADCDQSETLSVRSLSMDEGALRLAVTGELDVSSAERCADALAAAADPVPVSGLVLVDLRVLDSLSAAGVHVLEEFAAANDRRGVATAVLVDAGGRVERVLRQVPAAEPLRIHLTPREAVAAHGGHRRSAMPPAQRGGSVELEVAEPGHQEYDDSVLYEGLAALTSKLLEVTTVGGVLEQVVSATLELVPAADLVSVTLRAPGGECSTPVQTGPIGEELDRLQHSNNDGPCVEAAQPEGPGYVASDDLAAERRWPEFAATAVGHGLHAVLSTEVLPVREQGLSAAINIYSRQAGGLTESDRWTTLLLATHASLALAHGHTLELGEIREANLRAAIDSRDVIGQAKGILMSRQGLDADAAYNLLRHTSQELNVKVAQLAETLAGRHGELDSFGGR